MIEQCSATYRTVPCQQEAGHDGEWHTTETGVPFHDSDRD